MFGRHPRLQGFFHIKKAKNLGGRILCQILVFLLEQINYYSLQEEILMEGILLNRFMKIETFMSKSRK